VNIERKVLGESEKISPKREMDLTYKGMTSSLIQNPITIRSVVRTFGSDTTCWENPMEHRRSYKKKKWAQYTREWHHL